MCNTGKKIAICLLQNASPNFPMFCKAYARQNKKTNLIDLHIYLVETIALILHSKIVFKKFFWLKVIYTKKCTIMHLIPCGSKRSHILKQAYSF